MSQGQLKKVLILLTMSLRPKILILDEPTASIDPISRKEVLDMLKDFVSDEESSVLFSTHITSDLEKLADHVAFIDKGQLILNERRDILEESYRLLSVEDGNSILENLIGPINTAYGYRGLVATKFLKGQEGTIPSIEDLLLHFIRKGELEDEKVF